MANTTSKKTSATKSASTTKAQSAGIRASKYVKNKDILSICVLVSCLTAVLVTLIFNFGMKILLAKDADEYVNAKNEVASSYTESYKTEVADVKFDSYNFRSVSASAVLGLIESDASGFVYIEPADCNDACVDFREQLSYTQGQKADPIFAVYLSSNLSDTEKNLLKVFKLDVNGLPTLAYIKDGVIYDRLDNINSMDNLRNFLQNYR